MLTQQSDGARIASARFDINTFGRTITAFEVRNTLNFDIYNALPCQMSFRGAHRRFDTKLSHAQNFFLILAFTFIFALAATPIL